MGRVLFGIIWLACAFPVSAVTPDEPQQRECTRATQGDDCPAFMACYPQEGIKTTKKLANVTVYSAVCRCYSFYGVENIEDGACEPGVHCGDFGCPCECEPGPGVSTMVVVTWISFLFNLFWGFLYVLVTMYQMRKSGATKINAATATLGFVIVCELSLMILHPVYVTLIEGGDPTYNLQYNLRPYLFGFFIFGAVGGLINVGVLWLEVVQKTKSLRGNSEWTKKVKKFAIGSMGLLFVVVVVLMIASLTTYVLYFCVVYLLVLTPCYAYFGPKLCTALSSGKPIHESPSASSIWFVCWRNSFCIFTVYLALATFVVMGRKDTRQAEIGYYAIIVVLMSVGLLANCLTSYVRFGNRKKLSSEGFIKVNAVHGSLTTTNNTSTVSGSDATGASTGGGGLETPRADGKTMVTKPISPVLVVLNKIWALNFPIIA